jgi:hypothetical protein
MIIHFTGLENVNEPGVLLFPKMLVCLDCGFSGYTVPTRELALLLESISSITPRVSVPVFHSVSLPNEKDQAEVSPTEIA